MPSPILNTADNGNFYAYWSEGKRSRRKSMGTKDRSVAEQRFAQWILIGGHRNEITPEGKAAFTVGQLWAVYDEKHVQKETASPDSLTQSWNNLKPHFAALTLAEVTQDVVEEYGDLRVAGKIGRASKLATVRKELIALRACFNYCARPKHRPRILEKVDVPAFDLPPEADPRDRWLSTEEIKKILASAAQLRSGDRLSRGERFISLALETAARKQAILDLTWDRVDFEIGVIHYDVPGRRKTKKRRAAVAISDALLPILKRAYDERQGNLVMDHGHGVWATIQVIVERSGIAPKADRRGTRGPKGSGISPHTFRHTAATHMARRGVPLYDIAGVLGNSMAIVEKVYAKHCPGRLRAAVNSISSGVLEMAE
jgi:integrase